MLVADEEDGSSLGAGNWGREKAPGHQLLGNDHSVVIGEEAGDVGSIFLKPWALFRGLTAWAQVTIAFCAAVVLASPFTSDGHRTIAADRAPVTIVGPTTTGEIVVEVTTTIAATTSTVVPTTTSALPARVPAEGDDTSVVRVVDGDTIEVSGGARVRLIGIDTPETVDPGRPVQCFGPEATRYAKELLPVGTRVRLVYDVERLDRFGRTLAYVHKLADGVFVNAAVARNGFAVQATFPPNVVHAEEFRAAVAEARGASIGLWRACPSPGTAPPGTAARVTVAPVTAPTTRATVAPTPTTAAPTGGCHASYSGACVPTGFSDVDCAGGGGNGPGYVGSKNFQVVGPDEFGLDADGDGIGCESR